jgi:hypothetical protein
MLRVEQAVFTSAPSDGYLGSHPVGVSPGVCADDARELAAWSPAYDGLLPLDPAPSSFNFHPLPSGSFCISRCVRAGEEPGRRGGARVWTHCLVTAPDVLARFANNPWALYRAATSGQPQNVPEKVRQPIEPLDFEGGAMAVDQILLARLAVDPGPHAMAALVAAALDSVCLALRGGPCAEQLIAGLFSCLPLECRTEISFASGLRFSVQRPFRVVGFSGSNAEFRALERRYNLRIFDLSRLATEMPVPLEGWSRLIDQVLVAGQTSLLATELSKRRFSLTAADLPALAMQLLETLENASLGGAALGGAEFGRANRVGKEEDSQSRLGEDDLPAEVRHAHAAHRMTQGSVAAAAAVRADAPSKSLHPDLPEVLEKLEQLDDVVFEAISGKTASLETLRTFWPRLCEELGPQLLAESREQYLRYALSIWQECVGPDGVRQPARAIQAMDVVCVLFEECG